MLRPVALLLLLSVLPACAASPAADREFEPGVRSWGALREVLREGRTEGRVVLLDVLGPHAFAVGASAGLAAEITVIDGVAHLAEVDAEGAPGGLRLRTPQPGEQATLLVLAEVASWSEHRLSAPVDLAELEAAARVFAAESGIDVTAPFPFRVEGLASALDLHVLDHSCPIAHPDGPQPWRFHGTDEPVALIGFHAQDSAGVLTHHGQDSHTHALVTNRGISGHVDEVTLAAGARLLLPAH